MVSLKFNNIMIFLIIVGIMFIFFSFGQNSVKCSKQQVLYKYLPRDFDIDSNYPDRVSVNFKDMFTKPEPYMVVLGNDNLRKQK
jgi:hypothetical protein